MYVELNYHIGQYLAIVLLEFFLNNINIKNDRAKCYDNASNMSGILNET